MRLPQQKLLALPTSLLLFLLLSNSPLAYAGHSDQSPARWLNDRPSHGKYSSDDPPYRRRNLEAIQNHISAGHAPVVVKKMGEDESEMFFPEYWGFREQVDRSTIFGNGPADRGAGSYLREEFKEEEARLVTNTSTVLSMRPPFLVHAKQETSLDQRDSQAIAVGRVEADRSAAAAALTLLEKRQFACPSGTLVCSNAPNLCCATGETCVSITDTGIGSIGCCPAGYTCSGTITCVAGSTPCGSDIGGGCCIPGDVCASIGCVASASTSAVTVVSTSTQNMLASTNLIVVTTVFTPAESTIISTTTTTSSETSTSITTTNTDTASQQTTLTYTTSTTTLASAPVRQTSASDTAQVTTASTSLIGSPCPTGFYACSAYYAGGCCRTGRDCATTDCPSTASTTLVSSGVTIVVPLTGAATTTASGTCATGWYSCAATDGGSCCPSGWSCGPESCTSAGATNTATEAKEGVLVNAGAGLRTSPLRVLGVVCLMMLLLFLLYFMA